MNGGKFFHHSLCPAHAAKISEVEEGISFVCKWQSAGTDNNSIKMRGYGFFMITQRVTDQGQALTLLDTTTQRDLATDDPTRGRPYPAGRTCDHGAMDTTMSIFMLFPLLTCRLRIKP